MKMRISDPTRRAVTAGLAASAAGLLAGGATPPATARLALQARAATLALRPGQPATAIWELAAASPDGSVRLRRGDRCEVSFRNDLPVPVAPVWYGLDGVSAAEPLLGRPPIPAGGTETSIISVPHAGILMADLRLFEDGLKRPIRPLPIVVPETDPPVTDRDELFLIEDWRLGPDGSAVLPGAAEGDAAPIFTTNGRIAPDLTLRVNERLRLRVINGCQRAVVAVKFDGVEVLVIGLDGQPAEPFTARNGALVLAPGSRTDVIIDGTAAAGSSAPILLHDGKEARPLARLLTSADSALRPARLPQPQALPANGLPDHLDLRGALRFDVALGTAEAGWVRPSSFSAASAPAFRARAGRTVVLAVKNPASVATVFHLHGQHFRLLDRLDDGWKPYWLDTLAIEPGQTQRIAFAASAPGRRLIESVAADWTAPRLVRWYAVE